MSEMAAINKGMLGKLFDCYFKQLFYAMRGMFFSGMLPYFLEKCAGYSYKSQPWHALRKTDTVIRT